MDRLIYDTIGSQDATPDGVAQDGADRQSSMNTQRPVSLFSPQTGVSYDRTSVGSHRHEPGTPKTQTRNWPFKTNEVIAQAQQDTVIQSGQLYQAYPRAVYNSSGQRTIRRKSIDSGPAVVGGLVGARPSSVKKTSDHILQPSPIKLSKAQVQERSQRLYVESSKEGSEEEESYKHHYTISEDTIGASTRAKLSAIGGRPDDAREGTPPGSPLPSPRLRRASTPAGPPSPPPPLTEPRNIREHARELRTFRDTSAKDTSQADARQAEFQQYNSNAQYQRLIGAETHLSPTNPSNVRLAPDIAKFAPGLSLSPSERSNDVQGSPGIQAIRSGEGVAMHPDEEAPLPDTNLFQSMMQRIRELEAENQDLKGDSDDHWSIRVQTFHCLEGPDPNSGETIYLSEPDWEIHGQQINLRGRLPVLDPDGYAKDQRLAFAVYKRYPLQHQRSVADTAMKANEPLPRPEPTTQSIKLISKEIVNAMEAFFAQHPSLRSAFPILFEGRFLEPPYTWWYHCRTSHRIQSLPRRHADLVMAVVNWIETSNSSLYDAISEKFRRGKVDRASVVYLVKPGDVLVSYCDGIPSGYLVRSRPDRCQLLNNDTTQLGLTTKQFDWIIPVWSVAYAGDFFAVTNMIHFKYEVESEDDEVEIASLPIHPLAYATDLVKDNLSERGKKFLGLRNKGLVAYEGGSEIINQAGQRFMIDFNTYDELHPNNEYSQSRRTSTVVTGYLPGDGKEFQDPYVYLFPTMVPGFDLRRKKWVDLKVDQIRDVNWNEKAFKNLVADEDMKELILALVTNQLDAEKGTDIINNKGNGLIMLLHGPPGTGKTFTAESVAEVARKPLYPVTCGDMGTEPEAVEKYLQSVFHLGKIWDCVVLLDEAEVFLEQRTLQDLKRNALVSVFLRALEYYDGILILTTNRVGTFDEAFKSRIQLALRYEKLKDYERKKIWRNFFDRLKELGEDEKIDFEDVVRNYDKLSKYPMNGRQIRNSITTARQLAKYRGTKMTVSHLERAIDVADKFDKYLAAVQEGDVEELDGRGEDGRYSPEYFARADQVR